MLKWFGHMERMEESRMTRRVYVSEIEGGNVRRQPPVKWRDRVQEYVTERGEGSLRNLEQARGSVGIERDESCSALMGAPRSRCRNELNYIYSGDSILELNSFQMAVRVSKSSTTETYKSGNSF